MQPRFRTDMHLVIEASAIGEDFSALEDVIGQLPDKGVSVHEADAHSVSQKAGLAQTLILAVSSGASVTAISAVLIELIKSRRISIKIKRGSTEFSYEGPTSDDRLLKGLTSAVTGDASATGSQSLSTSPVAGGDESTERDS